MVDPGDSSTERAPLSPSARSSARLGLGEVDIIAPGLLHVRFAGAIRLEHLEPVLTTGNGELQKGHRLLLTIDADDVHAYKAEVRKYLQVWLRRHKLEIEGVWILFRAPVMKMGVALMNAFTSGMIRPFTDPEEFDVELSEATRRARAGWLVEPKAVATASTER